MEQWSVQEDDRPYLPPVRKAPRWLAPLLALILVSALGGYWWYSTFDSQRAEDPAAAPVALPASTEPAPQPSAPPAEETYRLAEAAPATPSALPTLDNSDALMRESLIGLMGDRAFAEIVVPRHLIRRIVATVDNLPRATAPTRVWPLDPVPGRFVTLDAGDEPVLDARNFARYTPYVRVLEAIDVPALVFAYVRLYPLFQRAYEELGFPEQYFNDRLMQALADLLEAPELEGPIELIRPKIVYEFADPDLETRSAGQKILMRMGSENASRVKAKLRELRRAIIAASERRQ